MSLRVARDTNGIVGAEKKKSTVAERNQEALNLLHNRVEQLEFRMVSIENKLDTLITSLHAIKASDYVVVNTSSDED